jgi:hypothetical protein
MTNVKFLLKAFLFVMISGLAMTSCEKEDDMDEMENQTQGTVFNLGSGGDEDGISEDSVSIADCLGFVFPITISLGDTITETFQNDEEILEFLEEWCESEDSDELPTYIFPIVISDDSGNSVTIADEDELYLLFEDCFGDIDDEEDDGEDGDEDSDDEEDCDEDGDEDGDEDEEDEGDGDGDEGDDDEDEDEEEDEEDDDNG